MTDMVTTLLADFADKGWQPRVDDDGDIALSYCDMTHVLCFSKSDEAFSTLLLPNLYEVAPDEAGRILTILNDINQRFKWIKGCIREGHVSFMVELWMMDDKAWREAMPRCLKIMHHALVLFAEGVHGRDTTK